jgi:hypothetical protein
VELCAAFEVGSTNSNGCPATYSGLATEAACKSLAAIASATYETRGNYTYYPAGCFWHTVSRKFYWNTHGSGASNSFAQPLCAGAPARLAPPPCVPPECVGKWLLVNASSLSYGTRVLGTQAVTRVLGNRAVLGYSQFSRQLGTQEQAVLGWAVLSGTWVLTTQAVPGCSVLGWFSGHSVIGRGC